MLYVSLQCDVIISTIDPVEKGAGAFDLRKSKNYKAAGVDGKYLETHTSQVNDPNAWLTHLHDIRIPEICRKIQ